MEERQQKSASNKTALADQELARKLQEEFDETETEGGHSTEIDEATQKAICAAQACLWLTRPHMKAAT